MVPLLAPVNVTCVPLHTVWSVPAFAVGKASIEILAFPETELEHAPLETETKVRVCVVVALFTVTVAVPPAPMVAVALFPPLIEYVTTWLAVPVKVNTAFCPEQTAAETAATEAVSNAG